MTRPRRSRKMYTPGWSGSARRCSRSRSAGGVSTAMAVAGSLEAQLPEASTVGWHMFRTRTQLLLPALAASLLLVLSFAIPASANYRVGISEQSPQLFSQPAWQSLKLKRVRYVVSWDWYKGFQLGETDGFMNAAHAATQDVLVMFSAKRGCYINGKYRRAKACRAPSTKAFRSSFTKFHKRYPWAKSFAPWNEANHVSQPTSKSPKQAARYYATLRQACKGCTVLSTAVLDQSNVRSWLRRFLRASHGKGRI